MALTRVRELYVIELSEMFASEQEIMCQLPLMAARSGNDAVREAFEAHYRATQKQIDRLTAIFDQLEERRRPAAARALRGLVEEARLRQALLDRSDLLDLVLIDMGRRIEHYEMAAYCAALGYARRIGDLDGAALLMQTLGEERRMDEELEALTMSPHAPAPRITAA